MAILEGGIPNGGAAYPNPSLRGHANRGVGDAAA